jgi:hypothetical protein
MSSSTLADNNRDKPVGGLKDREKAHQSDSSSTPPLREGSLTPEPAAGVLASSPARGVLNKEALEKRANGLVDEFLRVNDLEEAYLTVKELGPSVVAPLVDKVMTKYINCSKAEQQAKLVSLVRRLKDILAAEQAQVEQAVSDNEFLQVLTDTIVDCKSAPEWMGIIVGHLVSINAVSRPKLDEIVKVDIAFNIDEMMAPPNQAQEVFSKFLSSVVATASD